MQLKWRTGDKKKKKNTANILNRVISLEFGHCRKGKSLSGFTSVADQLKLSFSEPRARSAIYYQAFVQASWELAGLRGGSRQRYFSLPPLSPLIYLHGSTPISHACISGPALFNLVATRPLPSSAPLTNCCRVLLGFIKLNTHTALGRAPHGYGYFLMVGALKGQVFCDSAEIPHAANLPKACPRQFTKNCKISFVFLQSCFVFYDSPLFLNWQR